MRLHRVLICARCTVRLSHRSNLGNGSRFNQLTSKRFNSHVSQTHRQPRVAIVGSGPAGFYAAYRMLAKREDILVDMYEKLPVPFGLSRYGVAPDHPEVKVSHSIIRHRSTKLMSVLY